jgi:hypothetical protein
MATMTEGTQKTYLQWLKTAIQNYLNTLQ